MQWNRKTSRNRHAHRDRQTGTDIHTDRQTDRQGDLHEEHIASVVSTPVNSERLLLHQSTSKRLQVNVIAMLYKQ